MWKHELNQTGQKMATAKLKSKPGAICVAIRNCVTYKHGLRASFENWFTTKSLWFRNFCAWIFYIFTLQFKRIMMLITHPKWNYLWFVCYWFFFLQGWHNSNMFVTNKTSLVNVRLFKASYIVNWSKKYLEKNYTILTIVAPSENICFNVLFLTGDKCWKKIIKHTYREYVRT